jgi:hypothetical protein
VPGGTLEIVAFRLVGCGTNAVSFGADKTGDPVMVRVQPDMAKQLDDWRRKQEDLPGRPEAIRRLVEIGLKVKK